MTVPYKLRIPLDDHRFEMIGKLPDGTQFMAFITGAFPIGYKHLPGDGWRREKRWIAAIHRFDHDGNHLGTDARLGGYDMKVEKPGSRGPRNIWIKCIRR